MPKKKDLLDKLFRKPYPRNFTMRELDNLMSKSHCIKQRGGRGSGIAYVHKATMRVICFDEPHPGKELYRYQIVMIREFLSNVGELED